MINHGWENTIPGWIQEYKVRLAIESICFEMDELAIASSTFFSKLPKISH